LILLDLFCGGHADGAELDGRLYYRVSTAFHLITVRQKHMSRVQLVEIDLRAITSVEELHSLLMESLNFPGWYGANWDAFWDAITGLVEMPYTVRFLGWPQFSQRLPREAVLLKECLTEMQGEYPQLASKVVYA
jgi:RNAse (barnase) inhibitor barstar